VAIHAQASVAGEVQLAGAGTPEGTEGPRDDDLAFLENSAHGLAFDHHVHEGIHFVMSGGGGTGLCSHFNGVCTEGSGRPEDRGSLFHAVEITVTADGAVSGRVIQAFEANASAARLRFGD
jgi:hypothetical protein